MGRKEKCSIRLIGIAAETWTGTSVAAESFEWMEENGFFPNSSGVGYVRKEGGFIDMKGKVIGPFDTILAGIVYPKNSRSVKITSKI